MIDGRFELGARIAQADHADAYEARSGAVEVVVRLFRSHVEEWDAAYVAFEQRARRLLRLSHPGLVEALEYGCFLGRPYLVCEHARGQTLAEATACGRLSRSEVDEIASEVEAALAEAHRAGFVHGALRSECILLTAQGRARIAGIGVAPLAELLGRPELVQPGTRSRLLKSADIASWRGIREATARTARALREVGGLKTPHAAPARGCTPTAMAPARAAETEVGRRPITTGSRLVAMPVPLVLPPPDDPLAPPPAPAPMLPSSAGPAVAGAPQAHPAPAAPGASPAAPAPKPSNAISDLVLAPAPAASIRGTVTSRLIPLPTARASRTALPAVTPPPAARPLQRLTPRRPVEEEEEEEEEDDDDNAEYPLRGTPPTERFLPGYVRVCRRLLAVLGEQPRRPMAHADQQAATFNLAIACTFALLILGVLLNAH